MTVNESLQNSSIKSAAMTDRFITGEINKIQSLMAKTTASLQSLLIDDTKPLTLLSTARYERLLVNVKEVQSLSNAELRAVLLSDLKDFSGVMASSESIALGSAFSNVGLDVITGKILKSKVWGAVTSRPIMFPDGTTYTVSQAISNFNVKNTQAALSVIQQGYLLGESNADIARNLKSSGIYTGRTNAAKTLVGTLTNHSSSASRQYTYQENSDLVYGYEWLSTLDGRTTPICQDRDGQIHIYNEKDNELYGSGKSMLPGEVMPPAHYACRSTTTPLTRSWDDLGITGLPDVPEGTRASIDGQVSDKITYNDWFKTQPAAVQKDILGPSRYDLWKDGAVTDLSTFHTSTGRMLTLDQLEERLK